MNMQMRGCFRNGAGSSRSRDQLLKPQCLMIGLWSYTTAHRASIVTRNLGEDKWRAEDSLRKPHNWDQPLSSWQMRRQYYNYSSSELFLFFHLPFIFPPGGDHMACCLCLCAWLAVLVCVCVHVRGSKYSLENPIKGDMYWFAMLFKAFWDISTDVSFSVRASGRKQTNLPLLLPFSFSLFPLFYLFSFLSVTPHQSVLRTPSSLFLPPSHRYATACRNAVLRPSFCPSLFFAPWKSELLRLLGVVFGVGHSCA